MCQPVCMIWVTGCALSCLWPIGGTREACMAHAKSTAEQLKVNPVLPTQDTQNAPNVAPQTCIISVLGVDEPSSTSRVVSPSLGDR